MGKTADISGDQWQYARTHLPADLDQLAMESKAVGRWRDVKSGEQLLRTLLFYSSVNSLRTAASLASLSGLMKISAEGLQYRLKKAETFLENVLLGLTDSVNAPVGFRLFVVDATVVTGPGSKGTDWRIHVGYDPVRGVPGSVYTTDCHVGESLRHHPLEPGYLVLADRAYGTARNVDFAVKSGADYLIRVTEGEMKLVNEQGAQINWKALEGQVPITGAVTFRLRMPVPPQDWVSGTRWNIKNASAWHDVRLVAVRNNRKEVVWLITNLSQERLSDEKACELYRVRWQIELYFKRLKSIGDLDVITSRAGPTAKAALLAKLILLVLTSLLCDKEQAFSPYGYQIRAA